LGSLGVSPRVATWVMMNPKVVLQPILYAPHFQYEKATADNSG